MTAVYRFCADLVMLIHFGFMLFVVGALVLILVGGWQGWSWVRVRRFRRLHLGAIAFVVVQAWLGQTCPLTLLEMALRARAGEATYPGSFIAHWIESLLYYQAPPIVFTLAYTAFGLLVLISWRWVRPHASIDSRSGGSLREPPPS